MSPGPFPYPDIVVVLRKTSWCNRKFICVAFGAMKIHSERSVNTEVHIYGFHGYDKAHAHLALVDLYIKFDNRRCSAADALYILWLYFEVRGKEKRDAVARRVMSFAPCLYHLYPRRLTPACMGRSAKNTPPLTRLYLQLSAALLQARTLPAATHSELGCHRGY